MKTLRRIFAVILLIFVIIAADYCIYVYLNLPISEAVT